MGEEHTLCSDDYIHQEEKYKPGIQVQYWSTIIPHEFAEIGLLPFGVCVCVRAGLLQGFYAFNRYVQMKTDHHQIKFSHACTHSLGQSVFLLPSCQSWEELSQKKEKG